MSGELFHINGSQFSLISRGEPILLLISLGLLVFFFTRELPQIRKPLSRIGKRTWALLAALLIAATLFRMLAIPLTNRVYFDEDLYLNTGKSIADSLRACMCNGAFEPGGTCNDCILNKAPAAHPFVLSGFALFFGIGRAHFLNSLIFPTLSLLLAFLCAHLLFRSEKAGLLAVVFAGTVPVFLEWSMTAAAEPTLFFFSFLSLFLLLLFSETRRTGLLFAFVASLSFLVQTKAEGILFAPILFVGLLLLNWRLAIKKLLPLLIAALLFLLLSSVSIYHTYVAGKGSNWGADSSKFSVESFRANLPVNSRFLLFGYPGISHPFLLSLSAAAGLILLLLLPGRRGAGAFLLAWFLAFFLLYCSFYAGSVRYGTDVRYSLAYYPALILLASAVGRHFSRWGAPVFAALIIGSFAFASLAQVTTPAGEIGEAKLARDYKTFVEATDLPRNCTIISHVSTMYVNLGFASAQPWYIDDPALRAPLFERSDCVLFDYGFWCAVPPFKDDQCARLISTIAQEKLISDPSGNFGYYRVSRG